MDDILGLSKGKNGLGSQRVKELLREHLGLGEETVVLVSELHCHEEGCPDVETVIALMKERGERRSWKIAKALSEVTSEDIKALAP